MGLAIVGLGVAVPPSWVDQERASALSAQVAGLGEFETERLRLLYSQTGIARRHAVMLDHQAEAVAISSPSGPSTRWRMARYEETVRPLAASAARRAFEESGTEASAITHLITVSCTGFLAPGLDVGLIEDLGLDLGVERTHVGFMGCHGALNGLRVASALVGSDPSARPLMVAAELCSLHFRFGADAGQAIANALFADGAAAVLGTWDDERPWRQVASGSYVVPDSRDAMTWSVGDYGFEMTLSPQVPSLIRENLRPWMNGWLRRHNLSVDAIGSWAVHPGGPRILDSVERALGLKATALNDARSILKNYGNMSSPTMLFIMKRLRDRQAPLPCVALGFGPGLTIEAALFA